MPVSNSSPLIHLTRLGKIAFAKAVFRSLTIPPAVRVETIEKGKAEGYSDATFLERLEKEGFLQIGQLSSKSRKLANALSDTVGEGEAEAIALALQKKDRLLIDDLKGRRLAEQYKVESTTTLGVIFELFIEGALDREDYLRNVRNYGSQGWISGEIIQEFIERGKEQQT